MSEYCSVEKRRQSQALSSLVLSYVFFIRLINALTIKTFFQPDEFFQSLEPAHKLTYGYGFLTWEWSSGLRSSIVPLIYHLGFLVVNFIVEYSPSGSVSQQCEAKLILIMPKIQGAIIASIGDYYIYKFVQKVSKDELTARFALGLSLTNAFNWFMMTRSFSNSIEMVLTAVALFYWPWFNNHFERELIISCIFGITSCIIRPSNALIWGFLGVFLLYNSSWSKKIRITALVVVEVTVMLAVNTFVDLKFYGNFTLPWKNFVEFNIVKSLSIFYGSNPWHFYLFQSLPLMLLTNLPFVSYYYIKNWKKQLSLCTIFVIFIFSLIRHKEWRFLYPLQPVFLLFSSVSLKKLHQNMSFDKLRFILSAIIIINMIVGYFVTQVNERGVMDLMEYLRDDPRIDSVGLLTPCHSTPWQSHLHRQEIDKNSWFLSCEPPLHLQNSDDISSYKDQSDIFYEDPAAFLTKNLPPINVAFDDSYTFNWPSHLVFFEPLEEIVFEHLKSSQYQECKRFFNSYFHWDDRRRGDIIVYCNVYE